MACFARDIKLWPIKKPEPVTRIGLFLKNCYRLDAIRSHCRTACLNRQLLGLALAVLVHGEVGVLLLAAGAGSFLPGGYPGIVLFGKADADLARGIQRGDLARAVLGVGPVDAVDLLAFDVTLLLGCCDGLGLAAVLFVGERLLE